LLTFTLWLVWTGMDEGYAELGAHEREMLRAVVGAIVHVQALRIASTQERLLQHRQEGLRVTPAMEAGISDHVWSLEEIVRLAD